MQYVQASNRILIISNDSFIIGLLTGYCAANKFTLKCVSYSEPLHVQGIYPEYKVVIIDLRHLPTLLTDANLALLKICNNQYHIPICAISAPGTVPISLMKPWIDYYSDYTFIDKLDSYIHKYVTDFIHILNERRTSERRVGERRNVNADRRRATLDRRLPLDTVDSFSAKPSNASMGALNLSTDHESLGVFDIDMNTHIVYLKGKDLKLTGKEFKLFTLLAEDIERVCSTERIIKHLWPNRLRANKSDLYQYMHLLRKKVELDPDDPHWILTIKGVGYKLNVQS